MHGPHDKPESATGTAPAPRSMHAGTLQHLQGSVPPQQSRLGSSLALTSSDSTLSGRLALHRPSPGPPPRPPPPTTTPRGLSSRRSVALRVSGRGFTSQMLCPRDSPSGQQSPSARSSSTWTMPTTRATPAGFMAQAWPRHRQAASCVHGWAVALNSCGVLIENRLHNRSCVVLLAAASQAVDIAGVHM